MSVKLVFKSFILVSFERDFHIWTFIYDISDISLAKFHWRTDKDGVNPLSDIVNEVYMSGTQKLTYAINIKISINTKMVCLFVTSNDMKVVF